MVSEKKSPVGIDPYIALGKESGAPDNIMARSLLFCLLLKGSAAGFRGSAVYGRAVLEKKNIARQKAWVVVKFSSTSCAH